MAILLSFFMIVFTLSQTNGDKPYKLKLLSIINFSGYGENDGKFCRAAYQLAVDAFNNANLLQNYDVEIDFQDGGYNNFNDPTVTVNFWQKHLIDSSASKRNEFASPIVVGGFYTPGCQAVAPLMDDLDMILIAYGCLSTFFTANRARYPNMYRTRIPAEMFVYPRLNFMRNIGKWNQIALLAHSANFYSISMATALYEAAPLNGVNISFFTIIQTLNDETMVSLKDSGLRIIDFEVGEQAMVFRFWCQAYKFGISGSKYAFFFPMDFLINPASVPPVFEGDCPKSVMLAQFKISFFVGPSLNAKVNDGSTSLGYDVKTFDAMIDRMTNGSRSLGYTWRYPCHDQMLQALFTISDTEKRLGARNLTLKDYRDRPDEVMRVANQSAASIDNVIGIQPLPIHYSSRLEMDMQPQYVAQYTDSNPFRVIYSYTLRDHGQPNDLDDYRVKLVNEVVWARQNGKPPKDFWTLKSVTLEVPAGVFYAIASLAGLVIMAPQILCAVLTLILRREPEIVAILPKSKFFAVLGCLLMDSSAICFLTNYRSDFLCLFGSGSAVLGLSLLHGFIFFKLAFYGYRTGGVGKAIFIKLKTSSSATFRRMGLWPNRQTPKKGNKSTVISSINPTPGPTVYTPTPLTSSQLDPPSLRDKRVLFGTLSFFGVNAAFLIVWFLIDPWLFKTVKLTQTPVFDQLSDNYYDIYANICASGFADSAWIGALAGFHLLLLGGAAFLAYEMRQLQDPELKLARLAVVNEITLFLGVLLILFILSEQFRTQQIVIAIGLLLASSISSAVFFANVWRKMFLKIIASSLANHIFASNNNINNTPTSPAILIDRAPVSGGGEGQSQQ